jgi:hypothetical protein
VATGRTAVRDSPRGIGAVAFIVFAKLLGAPEVGEVLGALRKKEMAR